MGAGTDYLDEAIRHHIDDITRLFRKGAKVTIYVRNPKYGPNADVLVSSDDLEKVADYIKRRVEAG